MISEEQKLINSIRELDAQIEDYESRIRGLKADREGTMRALVELRMSRKPIIEA
jgi:hypothetical protein